MDEEGDYHLVSTCRRDLRKFTKFQIAFVVDAQIWEIPNWLLGNDLGADDGERVDIAGLRAFQLFSANQLGGCPVEF